MDRESGQRLKRYVTRKWGTGRRGMVGLAEETGVSKQTLYVWFRGENDPSLGMLTELSRALGVRRWEIVAAIDGDLALSPEDPDLGALIETQFDRVLQKRLLGQ